MDPFSLTAGALQIAGACAQCTVTIIKWVGDVRSVDARISSFCDEVAALQATYEGLERSLRSPLMAEAARVANQTSDGAHLWAQIKEALNDSSRTMKRVNEVLTNIARTSGFGRRIKTQLQESLASGELSRLRQRIQFFNTALSLPIQMVCVMLQLEQRGMTVESQVALDSKLVSLERTMRQLVQSLALSARSQTLGGSTIVADESGTLSEKEGMDTYIAFAKRFLSTASAAASTRSSLSTVSQPVEPDALLQGRRPSVPDNPLPGDHRARVADWIPPPSTTKEFANRRKRHAVPPLIDLPNTVVGENDLEVEFLRTKRHLKLGQERVEQNNHSGAETHFRKALALMENHDFEGRISFQAAEVVLMLAETCLKQDKLDDAVSLLEPVADMSDNVFTTLSKSHPSNDSRNLSSRAPDRLQALAASHMLAQVFLLKTDYDSAEEHALKAFTDRRRELGPTDQKTIESVQLVIDVYRAQGDEEEAEGYEVFLSPPEKTHSVTSPVQIVIPDETPRSIPVAASSEAIPSHRNHRNSRSSFAHKLRNFGRSSQSSLAQSPPLTDLHRLSISRSTTLNDPLEVDPFGGRTDVIRGLSSPSESSTHDISLSINDDDSVTPSSIARLERLSSSRSIEPTFLAVSQLCLERKYDKAVKVAMAFLDTYQSHVMIVRRPEIERNLRKGVGGGLASTGRGYGPIHFFCDLKEEHAEEVNLLIKQGVDVNAVAFLPGYTASSPRGAFTPLQQAVERGYPTITRLLLATPGIRTDVRDSDGMTPLMVACRKGHYNIVKQLLAYPLPTTFPQTWYGSCLMHDAARRCDFQLVEILLEITTDLDSRDRFGKTALMHAIVKTDISDKLERERRIVGRLKTVQLLLEAGADPTIQDNLTGLSVRDYTTREGDNDLMSLLDQIPRRGVSELLA
ncbi:uncharacterized protein A1O9_09198 [Exophiala aquamarina CBS 119918]|uniref:Uncharacterized protein n=1 Tax=Exophiala aquamarina CBS 119918 TaxID=1182545 RepID=A0A072P4L5_9EURO|nr:uncharacterized protein A1O9_09198 [Exophiala aquamarina CBS 119918]KEF54756.1 hypothetical protein A1O9_09198 [Exophiala aquamarina CBS 119918]